MIHIYSKREKTSGSTVTKGEEKVDVEKEEGWCKKEKLGGTMEEGEYRWKELGEENKVWKASGLKENNS